jgi:hypothetical protein
MRSMKVFNIFRRIIHFFLILTHVSTEQILRFTSLLKEKQKEAYYEEKMKIKDNCPVFYFIPP